MTLSGKLFSLALVLMLPMSCASNSFNKEQRALLNQSALYDPHSVTLIPNKEYQFEEGVLIGRGQVFHSQFEHTRQILESLDAGE